MAETETITYLISKENGDKYQVDVPGSWKVTFGPVSPGQRLRQRGNAGGFNANEELILRFYENDTKQRILIRDVAEFRVLSVPMRRCKVSVVETEGEALPWEPQQIKEEWIELAF